jgi:hypothetical protein
VDNQSFRATPDVAPPTTTRADRLTWVLVALISASYFIGLTPGHSFAQDDFAAYIMHAANLVEGRPYTEIRYVPNPQAPWIGPANGYPPAYPLLLAPVYWQRGLDLRTMKFVTVLTFAVFLVAYAKWIQPKLSPNLRVVAMLLVGLNPALWTYRDFISSEFPYLMFSFLALLAIQRANANSAADTWSLGWALLVAVLMYAAYATRTIGIALPIGLASTHLVRHKRPRRLLILTLALLAAFIALQAALITSPTGDVSGVRISAASVLTNLWSYAKSITFAWQNGFSRVVQVLLGIVLTGFAGAAFIRRTVREPAVEAFYLLAYLAILIAWGTQIGIRGLLPILPIYLTYVLLGIFDLPARMSGQRAKAFLAAIALCVAVTYLGLLRQPIRQESVADVQDASAQELFSFLRMQTEPSDLLVFSKPRTISLFTGRIATSLGPDEVPEDSAKFLQRTSGRFLIQARWNPPAYHELVSWRGALFDEVFSTVIFECSACTSKTKTKPRTWWFDDYGRDFQLHSHPYPFLIFFIQIPRTLPQ